MAAPPPHPRNFGRVATTLIPWAEICLLSIEDGIQLVAANMLKQPGQLRIMMHLMATLPMGNTRSDKNLG